MDDIERCLSVLEEALDRCRKEDVRYTMGIEAPLSFLEPYATEKWPFEQVCKALEDFDAHPLQEEGRWQVLNASLNGIKRVIRRPA